MSAAIDQISKLPQLDGQTHDFIAQMKNGIGLTFHSSAHPDNAAQAHLLDRCTRRKYVQCASHWFSIVVDPSSGSMRFGVMLAYPWAKDDGLEMATAHMNHKSNASRTEMRKIIGHPAQIKVGRNDPCCCKKTSVVVSISHSAASAARGHCVVMFRAAH